MPKIFIVRHGQDEDNANGILNGHRDTPLTKLGQEQAAATGQKLKDQAISLIFTSPLRRARQTAEIIGAVIGVRDISIDDRLIERDFGIMTGRKASDIPKYCKKIIVADGVNYFLNEKDAEEFPDLYQRAKNVVAGLIAKHPKDVLLLVTHNDMGKMLEAVYRGWDWEKALHFSLLRNAGIVELA